MPDDLAARARKRAKAIARYDNLASLARIIAFYKANPATITHADGSTGHVYTLLMNLQNELRPRSDGIADTIRALADRVDEQAKRIAELEGEHKPTAEVAEHAAPVAYAAFEWLNGRITDDELRAVLMDAEALSQKGGE